MQYIDKLPTGFVNGYKKICPPWGPLGYITYKRSYARKKEEENRTEEWHETVERCVNGIIKIGLKVTEEEAKFIYDSVFRLKCSFSGRALWQLGTSVVDKIGGDSIQNCWCVSINDPIYPFTFAFNELMLGGGVGFNIQREYVYEIPKVKYDVKCIRNDEKDVDFIVPDNREGWVELLRRTLESFFITGKSFTYSTICIRPKGALIKSFGGVASGPEDFCNGIDNICTILRSRAGKKLRPIDCLDIMNIIGTIVVSGNVRRSAQLALGDIDDHQFLDAKNWSKGSIPNWRSMSNNSIVCNKAELLHKGFWETYNGSCEPYGLINLKNCRKFGRLADGIHYRTDNHIIGTNPCGEVPLESYEACNLAEIFLPNIKDSSEFKKIAECMYKVVKTISCLQFYHDKTNEVVKDNHRLGISITGFLQSKFVDDKDFFNSTYKYIERIDKEYSKILGVKQSTKLTTVKPSGTSSLLPGVTPGVHPAYSEYYIRRIRMSSGDPLVDICRQHGYPVEPQIKLDGSYDMETIVVSFPIKTPKDTILAKNVSAIKQLEYQKFLQTYWSDNSVSVTIYYKIEELPEIKKWISDNYDSSVKSVSFLLHKDHGFKQAPYEEITEDQYKQMISKATPIKSILDKDAIGFSDSLECSGGTCPVK